MPLQETLRAIKAQIDASAIALNKKADEIEPTTETLPTTMQKCNDYNSATRGLKELGEIAFLITREIEAPSNEHPTALIVPAINILLRAMTAKAKEYDAAQEIKDLVFAQSDAIGAHLAALSNDTVMYSVEENRAAVTKPLTYTDPRLQVVKSYIPNTRLAGKGVHASVIPTESASFKIFKSEGHDTYIDAIHAEHLRLKYLQLSPEDREKRSQKESTFYSLDMMMHVVPQVGTGSLGILETAEPRRGVYSMRAMAADLISNSDNNNDNRRSASPSS